MRIAGKISTVVFLSVSFNGFLLSKPKPVVSADTAWRVETGVEKKIWEAYGVASSLMRVKTPKISKKALGGAFRGARGAPKKKFYRKLRSFIQDSFWSECGFGRESAAVEEVRDNLLRPVIESSEKAEKLAERIFGENINLPAASSALRKAFVAVSASLALSSLRAVVRGKTKIKEKDVADRIMRAVRYLSRFPRIEGVDERYPFGESGEGSPSTGKRKKNIGKNGSSAAISESSDSEIGKTTATDTSSGEIGVLETPIKLKLPKKGFEGGKDEDFVLQLTLRWRDG